MVSTQQISWIDRMEPDFQELVRRFDFKGDFISAELYGVGHINDTYILNFQLNRSTTHYILQRINRRVFIHPEEVMNNIRIVTDHIRKKIIAVGGDPDRETLTLIPTLDGEYFTKTDTGDFWRSYIFITNAQTYEVVSNLDHVNNAGKAYGIFQRQLSDFPPDKLFESISNFHNTKLRYKTLLEVIEMDVMKRVKSCLDEIDFVAQRIDKTNVLVDMFARGELPERITHNDTKFNNVMIDNETGEGICVIDLDTVMPGLSLYDFGDSIRSMTNPAAEDEKDLSKVKFDLQVYDCFTRGYLEAVGELLTSLEVEQLAFSAQLMTLECGIRFLTDYLQGDIYFKTQRKNQNLDRCRVQFRMVQDMEERYDEMVRVVETYR